MPGTPDPSHPLRVAHVIRGGGTARPPAGWPGTLSRRGRVGGEVEALVLTSSWSRV